MATGDPDPYVLATGEAGASRLRLLERLYGPATEALLGELVRPGDRVVDVGCGVGTVTAWMGARVGPTGTAIGVDEAGAQLAVARADAVARRAGNVRFEQASAYRLGLADGSVDLAFCRSLLSHLADPLAAVREMVRVVRPGGVVVLEDIDMASFRTEPPSPAYARIQEIFFALGPTYGADYRVGRRLVDLLRQAGVPGAEGRSDQPAASAGEEKRYWEYTFLEVAPAMVRAGVTTPEEVASLAAAIAPLGRDATTRVAHPARFQAWGRRPA